MKTELIKQLYDEGKITFEQAMTLASNEEAQTPAPVVSETPAPEISKKDALIKSLVDDIVESKEDDILIPFDIDKVVKYMRDDNWTWNEEDVTHARFEETLRTYLKEVITDTVNDYLAGDWEDDYSESSDEWPCHHTIQGGGIEVESWYNYEDQIIEASAKFVIEETMANASVDLLK